MWRGRKRAAEARQADAQEWTAARLAGRSVAEIAAQAGVSSSTVSRATSSGGPSPASSGPSPEAAQRWVRQRRDGMSVRQVAAQAGVSITAVSAATKPHGPYPRRAAAAPQRGEQWAQLRAAGESVTRIARRDQVGVSLVSKATRRFGPFPPPSPAGAGTMSLRGVSRVSGLTLPALRARIDHGELPAPAGHRPGGWPYWDAGDIQRWLEQSPHPRCPICQARPKRLGAHLLRRHGVRASPS